MAEREGGRWSGLNEPVKLLGNVLAGLQQNELGSERPTADGQGGGRQGLDYRRTQYWTVRSMSKDKALKASGWVSYRETMSPF